MANDQNPMKRCTFNRVADSPGKPGRVARPFVVRHASLTRALCVWSLVLGPWFLAAASLDLLALQSQVTNGQPAQALERLAAALEQDPDNARLLYNHAVAAYAAGRFEEALLSLDRAESHGSAKLIRRAKFQKGNAEYRLGVEARKANLDETIARWREAIRHYADVLKERDDADTNANFEFVRRQLLELLLAEAKKSLQAAQTPSQTLGQKLEQLRSSFDKFQEAKEVAPESQEAQQGEQQAREQLAQTLAREGTRKTLSNRLVQPGRFEAPIPRPDYKEIEEGVAMLEDAQQLKPDDKAIEQALKQGKDRLADALTLHAQILMAQEPNMPWPKERLAILRMAKEQTEKALDKVPQHQRAQQTLDEANRRLANLMEELADQLAFQAEMSNLEMQTQQLTQALDFYQQSQELQPQNQRIPPKAERTQERLEQALDQLADKLMKLPGQQESLEGKAARLEGAQQSLDQLQGLNPSERTAQRAEQVGKELGDVRDQLAQQPGQDGQPMSAPGGQQMAQQMHQFGMPIDAPPRVNTPGMKGEFNSNLMNKKQDY